jgi:hypothetical protein
MRWLQGMGAQVVALLCGGGDGWSAQQCQFLPVLPRGHRAGRIGGKRPRQVSPVSERR